MRKLILHLIIGILIYGNVNAQWTAINSGTTSNLEQIIFPDSLTGYILTSNSSTSINAELLKTTDGGYTWNTVLNNHVLRCFYFLNSDTGAVLAYDTVYKTTDGGITWNQFYSNNISYPVMFQMNSADEWFYIAAQGTAFTYDGGVTWNGGSVFGTIPIVPTDFQFVNDTTVIGVGWYAPKSFISYDKGLHWVDLSYFLPMGSGMIWSVCFTNASTGFATGNSRILKSTDGGLNWIKIDSTLGFGINCIRSIDVNNLYGVGYNGGIAKTSDGGMSWTTDVSGTTNTLNKIVFINSHTAIAIGDTGTILMNTNISTGVKNEFVENIFSMYPNPVSDFLNIPLSSEGNFKISLTDILGQQIFSQQIPSAQNNIQINTSELNNGIYFINLQSEKINSSQKVIINHN